MWKKNKFLILAVLIAVPAIYQMLKFGIYSMQDFHLFRLYEFNSCVQRFEIPCRWAQDAGLGFGEPLFNFYGQLPYLIGEIFYLISGSYINSIKFLFILSIIGSSISMYFLSKELWKNNWGAIFSSIIYVYAPYRAVDVWVRGALPEAFAFILIPLIILAVEKKNIFYFSILSFLLIITHNLSFVMLLPFLIAWMIYRKWWKGFFGFILSGLLSSFYVLPVIFESKFVNLESTTLGYFDFRAHFITLKQIFFDTTWGYGGSTWGPVDNMNLSVGVLQWAIPVIIFAFILLRKNIDKLLRNTFYLLLFLGFSYLLLTHNKTAFIWEILPFMKYIQFPWRFLGMAVFIFSLASGIIFNIFDKKMFLYIVFALIVPYILYTTYTFFRPDIWYPVSDSYFLTGEEWDRQRTASIGDFWPKFGHEIPSTPSDGKYINYFLGWESPKPMQGGLIIAEGSKFKNTPIRTIGNIITLVSLFGIIIWKRKLI
jgi:hypothetical protein